MTGGMSSSFRCFAGFDFGNNIPPRNRGRGKRLGTRMHTAGAERSGALGGFAESCAGGLSWHNRPGEGETKLDFSCEFYKRMRLYKRGCD